MTAAGLSAPDGLRRRSGCPVSVLNSPGVPARVGRPARPAHVPSP